MEELGYVKPRATTETSWKKNAQRNAWKTLKMYGIGWRVPLSHFDFTSDSGEMFRIPYIAPKSLLEYLLKHCPEVLLGEAVSGPQRADLLTSFWNAYKLNHETHKIFDPAGDYDFSVTTPLLIHGDEGRGKRRTNTLLISLESPLGIRTKMKKSKKRKHCMCQPPGHHLSRFPATRPLQPDKVRKAAMGMRHNTKGVFCSGGLFYCYLVWSTNNIPEW